jgi:hypothetical protein
MADLFISYARSDREKARQIATAFEIEGYTVFYDADLAPGDAWDRRIEDELASAAAVVVLWSEASRDRTWVRNEAREALARGILCPASIETCSIPVEFSHLHSADLRDMGNVTVHAGWKSLVETVSAKLRTRPSPERELHESDLPAHLADQLQQAIHVTLAEHARFSLTSVHPKVRAAADAAREAELRALRAQYKAAHAAALAGLGVTGYGVTTNHYGPNREEYSGQIRDNKGSGYGVYHFFAQASETPTLRYGGQFQYGKRSGYGVSLWRSGNRFSGCLLNAEKSGWGVELSYGNRYEGAYASDKANGLGLFWNQRDGSIAAGIYAEGRLTKKAF